MTHALDWFEIPVSDLPRAQSFYESLLAVTLRREAIGDSALAVFPSAETGVGGCLMAGPGTPTPSVNGTMVYLDAVLARVEAAGGHITTPKVQLPGDMGVFAHVTDTEGNRIGLHAAA
jgi:uncharacterized protein